MYTFHPQAICTVKLVIIYLKTVVFYEKYSEKWHLPDASPQGTFICTFVLMSKKSLFLWHLTAYLNGTHPHCISLIPGNKLPGYLKRSQQGTIIHI